MPTGLPRPGGGRPPTTRRSPPARAMRSADVDGAAEDRAQERTRIRDALVALDGPQTAVPGLLGPIYFDETRTTPRTAFFGVARDGLYVSAPEQLRPYSPSAGVGMAEDMASGMAMEVEGQMLQRERVVFAGININEIGELDTANPSFYGRFLPLVQLHGRRRRDRTSFSSTPSMPDLSLGDPVRTVVDGDIRPIGSTTSRAVSSRRWSSRISRLTSSTSSSASRIARSRRRSLSTPSIAKCWTSRRRTGCKAARTRRSPSTRSRAGRQRTSTSIRTPWGRRRRWVTRSPAPAPAASSTRSSPPTSP